MRPATDSQNVYNLPGVPLPPEFAMFLTEELGCTAYICCAWGTQPDMSVLCDECGSRFPKRTAWYLRRIWMAQEEQAERQMTLPECMFRVAARLSDEEIIALVARYHASQAQPPDAEIIAALDRWITKGRPLSQTTRAWLARQRSSQAERLAEENDNAGHDKHTRSSPQGGSDA